MNKKELTFHKSWWAQLWQNHIWEKQKKLKFTSRITASRMIFKRFDANVVEMIFRGRLAIGGGRWWLASSQSEGFSLKQMLIHKHSSLQLQADCCYDTDACQILKEKISTASSPKNRPLQNLVKIWMTSTFGQAWSMINVSKVTPLQKWSFYEFCILLAVFLDE